MASIRYRLRADLRRGWRSLLVIAVLVGLSGGAALASLAAARRTDTAFARMRQATDAWDVLINPNNGVQSALTMKQLRRLPGVERIGAVDGIIVYPSFVGSVPDAFNIPPTLVADADATYTVGRPLMVAGRQPAADDPDGVWIDRTFAARQHLRVGQHFHYVLISPDLLHRMQTAHSEAEAHAILRGAPASMQGDVRIDGIGMTQDGVAVDPGYDPLSILFTPAFAKAHPNLQIPYWGAMVKLAPGTDIDAFTARVQALVPHESIAFQRASAVRAEVTNAADPEVSALEAFAVLAALLGLVVVAQAISRRMQIDAGSNATLATMGATRPQRMAVSMAKAMLAVAVGAGLAVAVAVAASPLGPVGAVRLAEVHPGVTFDWAVLVWGGLAILVVGSAVAAVPAWRNSRVNVGDAVMSRSHVAAAVASAGGSLAAVMGVRFGLEPGAGRTSVPVRTTLLAAATAVALVTSVAVFSGSLDHLLTTPQLYGSGWDAQIQLDNLNTPAGYNDQDPAQLAEIQRQFVAVADRSDSVAASALLDVGEVRSGAVAIPALGYLDHLRGVTLTIAEGRAPTAPDEVALGQTTMDQLHTRIGATIELAQGEQGPNRPVMVVGRTVLPGLAPYPGSDKAGLGVGALFSQAGWKRFSSDFGKIVYVFRWAPGKSLTTLSKAYAEEQPAQLPLAVDAVNRPAGVVSLQRLRATPTLLASLVAVLLAAAVANALVVAVRRRRRDLAILHTLGCTTGQVVRTVLWQATTVGTVAVIIGIPAGVIIGRWTWTLLADRLGIVPVTEVSALVLVGLSVTVLALANAVGVVPGLRAARAPGQVLRAE
jgi:putative ABC transport system permease protein